MSALVPAFRALFRSVSSLVSAVLVQTGFMQTTKEAYSALLLAA